MDVYKREFQRTSESHKQGLISSMELREAQLALMSARLRLTELQLQLKQQETALLFLSGRLLEIE